MNKHLALAALRDAQEAVEGHDRAWREDVSLDHVVYMYTRFMVLQRAVRAFLDSVDEAGK